MTGQIRTQRFDRVTFGYRADQHVLHGIELTVSPGEVVALVGPSGAGKSTLMGLLQRLYDPSAGCVRIDGIDIRSVK
jgi:ABC-type multidrug transport system fused ATPase/permease subunit